MWCCVFVKCKERLTGIKIARFGEEIGPCCNPKSIDFKRLWTFGLEGMFECPCSRHHATSAIVKHAWFSFKKKKFFQVICASIVHGRYSSEPLLISALWKQPSRLTASTILKLEVTKNYYDLITFADSCNCNKKWKTINYGLTQSETR